MAYCMLLQDTITVVLQASSVMEYNVFVSQIVVLYIHISKHVYSWSC